MSRQQAQLHSPTDLFDSPLASPWDGSSAASPAIGRSYRRAPGGANTALSAFDAQLAGTASSIRVLGLAEDVTQWWAACSAAGPWLPGMPITMASERACSSRRLLSGIVAGGMAQWI